VKKWFLILGSVVPLPVAFLSTLGFVLASTVVGGGDLMIVAMVASGILMLLSLLWFAVVAFWVLYDLLTGVKVAEDKRMLWIAGWLFFNAFAVIAYTYLFVWKAEEPAA